MLISDFIAMGILFLCILLGISGGLKWLLRLLAGTLLGLLILVVIGFLIPNQKFNSMSRGVFQDGVVIPYVMHQVSSFGEFLSQQNESFHQSVAMNE